MCIRDRYKDQFPELALFDRMLEYEQTIDELIARKRYEIPEMIYRPPLKVKRVLRLHVFNEHYQPPLSMPNSPPHWTLKIRGRLLNDDGLVGSAYLKKLSYFIRQVEVVFNHFDYPDAQPIVWKRSASSQTQDFEALEIRKMGNRETTVKIFLHIHQNPPKYKLTSKLESILGLGECTRVQTLVALWEYIKMNRLQDKEHRNLINNDAALFEAFGVESMQVDSINARLKALLEPLPPLEIEHRVRLQGSIEENESFFDTIVEVDYPLNMDVLPFYVSKFPINEERPPVPPEPPKPSASPNQKPLPTKAPRGAEQTPTNPFIALHQNVKKIEKRQAEIVEKLKKHKAMRDAFEEYRKSPSVFIENFMANQTQLLKVMTEPSEPSQHMPSSAAFLLEHEDIVEREIRNYTSGQTKPSHN
eukprot:TRINITY_DN24549_c0_g1_i2.p1 TRINITY_DN24549_c0_g1~~TRINITY_DN24549_c0_g1_i2.p1  ORF type:complete len:417 (-),score=80.86 TRINITY_DN24549_c0_g1_i2:36-1286(-)